jgi:hypothetical protein
MTQIEKISLYGDTLYLRKSFDGWRVVYPYKNEDGSLNLTNLILGGNIWIFLKLALICFVLVAILLFYSYDMNNFKQTIIKNIDVICDNYNNYKTLGGGTDNFQLNIGNLTWNGTG